MANNFPTIKPSLNLQFSNTGALPPDVTFTRASSSGGYYDGKTVAKAEENLLLRSEEFDNAYWSKFQATIDANTAETTDPIGTNTADKMTTTSTSGSVNRSAFSAGTFTLTIYAKEGTGTSFAIDDATGGNGRRASFDLSAGTTSGVSVLGTGGTSSGGTALITDVGGGWYRCVFSEVTNSVGIRPIFACLDNLASVYIWGAQLEQRSSATAYTPTTTQPITNYVPKLLFAPAGVPVFDHNPTTGEALGLSVFEARTNLLVRSEEFNNAAWTKSNSTISANQVIAPDGALTADKLVENTANSTHSVVRNVGTQTGTFRLSVYLKAGERTFATLREGITTGARATFNLSTGVVVNTAISGTAPTITPVGNGWYRCSISATVTAAGIGLSVFLSTDGTDTQSYTGDGYSGIYIWGAQLEAGAFATPYIPTVASTVARSADVAVMTGANFSRWFRADEGAFTAEFNSVDVSAYGTVIQVDDGSNVNRHILIKTFESGSSRLKAITITNSVLQADLDLKNTGVVAGQFYKSSYVYKTNDFAGSADGGAIVTDTSGIVGAATQMGIGVRTVGNDFRLNGYIKSLQYYPARLTNDNLVAVSQ